MMESEQLEADLRKKCIENLITFVKHFVITGDKKISEYYHASLNETTKPSKKTQEMMDKVEASVLTVGMAAETSTAIRSGQPLTTNMEHVVKSIKNIVYRNENNLNKQKAEKFTFLIEQYNNKSKVINFRENLLKTAVRLFRHYEYQFMQIKKKRSEQQAMKEMANLCIKRLFGYFYNNQEVNEEIENVPTENLFLKLIAVEDLKYWKLTKSYKFEVRHKKTHYEINDFFSKPKIVVGDKYYFKINNKEEKNPYGYRLKFDWDKLEDYEEENPKETYEYLLTEETIDDLKEMFEDIIYYDVDLSPPIIFGIDKEDADTKIKQHYLIDQIEAKIDQEIVVLAGLPGVGKTTLAQQYAYMKSKKNRHTLNIVWIGENIQLSFEKLYQDLQLNVQVENGDTNTNEKETIEYIINAVFDSLKSKLTLFIFDNVEEFDALKNYISPLKLQEFLGNFQFLVTSKNSLWESLTQKIHVIDINGFKIDEVEDFIEYPSNNYSQPATECTFDNIIDVVTYDEDDEDTLT